jgi:hypothetical protein
MGWNTFDAYGCAINEQEFKANAEVLAEKLLPYGYRYAVVDSLWWMEEADAIDSLSPPKSPPHMDDYGRFIPCPHRFGSCTGSSLRPLADWVHAQGLKFGIQIIRGIPRLAVQRRLPIFGASATAADVADPANTSEWDVNFYGMNFAHRGAQAYYDSILALYAAWGLDLLKADDMCIPYYAQDIDALFSAVERCGRPIVLSLAPGVWIDEMQRAWPHVSQRSEMWRITWDMWDNWPSVRQLFMFCSIWAGAIGPNSWPDADMLPYGKLNLKHPKCPGGRWTNLTREEIRTHFTLLCVARSPLMIGADLLSLDDFTLAMLTNTELLDVNQNSTQNRCPWLNVHGIWAWIARMADGDMILAMFNLADEPQSFHVPLSWLRVGAGRWACRDLWERKDLAPIRDVAAGSLQPHASVVYRLRKQAD